MSKTKQVDDKSLKNDGERLIPAYSRGELVYGEHIIRYEVASELVRGKKILDIASGSGYGSAILAQKAKHVFGVDNNKKAIEYAKKNYGSKNISFLHGDGAKIPLEDHSVDMVVSFETIEHIKNYREFMKQVKRVLKPGGLFILSTPNDLEYPEGNHFHIHEFTPKELQKLADQYFSHTKSYYQGNWLYNALADEQLLKQDPGSIPTIQLAPIKIDQCIYMFMLCSDKPIKQTVKPLAAMSEHWSERKKVEEEFATEKERSEHIKTIRRLEKTIDKKHQQLLEAHGKLNAMKNSRTWRLHNKLANVKKKTSRSRRK